MAVAMLESVWGAAAEEERLRALADLGISGTGREERFDRITRLARQLFGVERVAITLVDRDVQWFKSEQGFDGVEQVPRAPSFCNATIAQPGLTVSEDTRRDLRFARNPYVTGQPHVRFYAGHPLVSATGHAVGTLCLFDAQPRTFSAADRKMLTELGGWVETELNHSQEMERAAEVQRALVPRPGSVGVPGYKIEGTCLPARSVGGDLVDWFLAPDDDVVVALGDVMGKGIGAALMAAAVRSTLRTSGRLFGPADAIRETALALDDDLQSTSTLVTLCLGRLTPATGELRWSDAGHGLLMLMRADGRVLRPTQRGLPLGTLTDDEWPERTIYLERGDIAVAFSDGLLDLFPSIDATVAAVAAGIREDPDTAVDRLREMAQSTQLADDVAGVMIRRCE
jgi:Stage II sporulation protein E (SpoIIE)/GAF domain